MENFVRHDTTGTIEEVDAKYELLQRGQYTLNVNPSDLKPVRLDSRFHWNYLRRETRSRLHDGPGPKRMPETPS